MDVESHPPAMDLLRSSSSNDILTELRPYESSSSPPVDQLRLIKTTVINSQPQDFVVTNGQTYRINRSPIGISLRGKRSSPSDINNTSTEASPEQAKIKMLLKALDDANRKIADQSNEISNLHHNETIYRQRINSLEKKYGEEITTFPDSKFEPTASDELNSKGTELASRHRNKLQCALRNEKEMKVRTYAPSLTQFNQYDDDPLKIRSFSEDSSSFTTPPVSNQSTPSSTGTETTVNILRSSQEGVLPAAASVDDTIDHSPIKTDPDTHLDNMLLMDNALKQNRIPPKKSALAARLEMSAKERRSKDKESRSIPSSNIRKLKSSPNFASPSYDEHSNQVPYIFHRSEPNDMSPSCTLFIAHDNPQLGKTVSEAICTGMELMIESKSHDGKVAFVLANIVYSGPVEKVLISSGSSVSAPTRTLPRGSQCLVCTDLRAFAFDLSKDCETRVQGVIAEVSICPDQLPGRCTIDVTKEESLMTFFRSCEARVDVILSPHHSQSWYPYWEYGSPPSVAVATGTQPGVGARKMAPQFRSKGIGYLRLGDDMSRFGTSFLSCDGFETFMDEGKGGVEDKLTLSLQNADQNCDMSVPKFSRAVSLPNKLPSSDNSALSSIENCEDFDECLKYLMSPSLKWSDKVGCLQKIYDYLDKNVDLKNDNATLSVTSLEYAATCLYDVLITQKNPIVLKEATRCTGCIGTHFSVLDIFNVKIFEHLKKKWMDLFVMCVHNLRHANRGVSEAAKASLSSLIGSRVTHIKTLGCVVRDLIAGPVRSSSTSQVVSSAPNSVRVLQWMMSILEDYSRQIYKSKFYAAEVDVVSFQDSKSDNEVYSYLGYSYNDVDSNSIVLMAQGVIPLLSHKDVSVREAAVTLSAQLFSLDLLHCGKVSKFNLNSYSSNNLQEVDRGCTNDLNLLPFPNDCESLINSLSKSCQEMFLSAMEKKIQLKVAQRTIEYANKLYSTKRKLNNNSDSLDGSTSVSTEVSPPTELKKSLSSLSNQKHRRRKLQTRRSSDSKSDNEAVNGISSVDPLVDMFFEVNLSLKTPPSDEKSWSHFSSVSQSSPKFFMAMKSISQRENLSLGSLLSKALPFTEETSSNDQSNVFNDVIDTDVSHIPEMKFLRAAAVDIRAMIRVKMADENDLKQAENVMKQLVSFVAAVELRSSDKSITPVEVLQSLKMSP